MKGLFGTLNRSPLSINKTNESEYLSGMKANLANVRAGYDKNKIKLAALSLLSEAAEIYDNIGDAEMAAKITGVITDMTTEAGDFEDE